jgi:hypothetical protein
MSEEKLRNEIIERTAVLGYDYEIVDENVLRIYKGDRSDPSLEITEVGLREFLGMYGNKAVDEIVELVLLKIDADEQ